MSCNCLWLINNPNVVNEPLLIEFCCSILLNDRNELCKARQYAAYIINECRRNGCSDFESCNVISNNNGNDCIIEGEGATIEFVTGVDKDVIKDHIENKRPNILVISGPPAIPPEVLINLFKVIKEKGYEIIHNISVYELCRNFKQYKSRFPSTNIAIFVSLGPLTRNIICISR
ncbi:MAG: hypothetical protein RXR43_16735 [Sulfolobus sp.]